MVLARGQEEGEWRVLFNEDGVSVWEGRKLLSMGGGDGCTTM